MAKTQPSKIAAPGARDKDSLKDYTAVIQEQFNSLFESAHDHLPRATVPTANEGAVGDIIPVATVEGGYYAYVKLISGWVFGLLSSDGSFTIPGVLTMGGALVMGGNKVTGLGAATSNGDAVRFEQLPSVATQAEMEAASSNTPFVSPGRMNFHPGVAKVLVKIIFTAGTPSAPFSYGVTSLTDEGTGDVRITFSTAFSSSNYVIVATGTGSLAGDSGDMVVIEQNTGNCRIGNRTSAATFAGEDRTFYVAIYGDQ